MGRLEVHHVDGDPSNNTPDNLTTYCRGCHIRHHAPVISPEVAAWRELVDEAERTLYGISTTRLVWELTTRDRSIHGRYSHDKRAKARSSALGDPPEAE